jgi:ERI1 exoribonuclease 3
MNIMDKVYYCVLDFEATCWDNAKNKGKPSEIIEFPSVLYEVTDTGLFLISKFRKYCKPVLNPKLSQFCTDLTGIQQATVDVADIFPEVLKQHHNWLLVNTNGSMDKLIFVTCGSWDFTNALNKELGRWIQNYEFNVNHPSLYNLMLNVPDIYKNFINLKDIFISLYKVKAGGMVSMLNYLNIKLEGRHHSGLDDCGNIGKILQKMYLDGRHEIDKHFPIIKINYKHKDPRPMWLHNPKFKK